MRKSFIVVAISQKKVETIVELIHKHNFGFDIHFTGNSDVALEDVPNNGKPYILITGQTLIGPKIRGAELIQKAKEKNPNIQSILFTSNPSESSNADFTINSDLADDVKEKELIEILEKFR